MPCSSRSSRSARRPRWPRAGVPRRSAGEIGRCRWASPWHRRPRSRRNPGSGSARSPFGARRRAAEKPDRAAVVSRCGKTRQYNGGLVGLQQPDVDTMTSFASRLGMTGVDEQPIQPGLEPVRIPQAGQVAPRVEQRLLRGILGQVRVTQDPARNRMGLAGRRRVRSRCRTPLRRRAWPARRLRPSVSPADPLEGRFAEYES